MPFISLQSHTFRLPSRLTLHPSFPPFIHHSHQCFCLPSPSLSSFTLHPSPSVSHSASSFPHHLSSLILHLSFSPFPSPLSPFFLLPSSFHLHPFPYLSFSVYFPSSSSIYYFSNRFPSLSSHSLSLIPYPSLLTALAHH